MFNVLDLSDRLNLKSPLMKEMALDCEKNHVALISPETANLLTLLIDCGKYNRVLEIGTGLGYSTILFAQAVALRNGSVDTIERLPQRVERA